MANVEFPLWDAGGNPKTGAVGSLSFVSYTDETGTPLPQPSFVEVGGGIYRFSPTFSRNHGIVYKISTGNAPAYFGGYVRPEDYGLNYGSPQIVVFHLYDSVSGAPKTGVAGQLSFTKYADDAGNALTPPTLTEIAGGAYKFTPVFPGSNNIAYMLNAGSGVTPAYLGGSILPSDFLVSGSPLTATTRFVGNDLVVTFDREVFTAPEVTTISNYYVTAPNGAVIPVISKMSFDASSTILTVSFANPSFLVGGAYTLVPNPAGLLRAVNDGGVLASSAIPFIGVATTTGTTTAASTTAASSGTSAAEALIRKHLPSSFVGKAWDALIAALAVGEQYNWDNAVAAFDQLFLSSASGMYLERLANDEGVKKPLGIGMPDDLFRQLAITTSTGKLTREVLWEILEVYYGPDAVRANSSTGAVEPFPLSDGATLNLLLDGEQGAIVTFSAANFTNIGAATAEEVAAVITRALKLVGSKGWAVPATDPSTGLSKVKIYSGSLGLGSSVMVTGGRAQLGLKFPTPLTTYNASVAPADNYLWAVTNPSPGINQVQLSNNSTSKVDLSTVQAGDYVVFQAVNSAIPAATYEILSVGVYFSGTTLIQYFQIPGNVAASNFQQLNNSELTFFRPTKVNAAAGKRTVVLAQVGDGLDIQIPATTQAVGRTLKSAAYLHETTPIGVTDVFRAGEVGIVETSGAHGLKVGDQITVDDAVMDITAPAVTAGTASSGTTPGISDASLATIWTQTGTQNQQSGKAHVALQLNDGRALISGGYYDTTGGPPETYLNSCELFTVSSQSTLGGGAIQYTYAWSSAGAMAHPRAFHAGSILTDTLHTGKVLVTGGYTAVATITNTTELYTPATGGAGSWANTASMATARIKHGQVTLSSNNKVLITGGTSDDTSGLSSCELYDPTANTWAAASSMIKARCQHQTVLLNNGKVLVIGGRTNPTDTSGYHSSCELYDPVGNTWSMTGRMSWSRVGHTATVMADGRVLVIGGSGAPANKPSATPTAIQDAEVYDPTTGRWAPAGKMMTARSGHGAVRLPSNQVVIAGGGVQAAEYFDGNTFKWRYVPNTPTSSDVANYAQSLTPVTLNTKGMALLHGGYKAGGAITNAWLFQQADDSWAQGGMNGTFAVSQVVSPTEFMYLTPGYSGISQTLATPTVRPMAAPAGGAQVGPYVYDPLEGVAVTAVETEATMDLEKGQQYGVLNVADASAFPDAPGWLAIGFGRESAVSPVKYLGKLSSKALILDYGQKFAATNAVVGFTVATASRNATITTLTLDLPAGATDSGIIVGQVLYFNSTAPNFTSAYVTVINRTATTITYQDSGGNVTDNNPGTLIVSAPRVTLLAQKGAFVPAHPEQTGAFYLTGSSAGRVAAEASIADAAGSGIQTNVEVRYPGDRGLGGEGLPTSGQARLSDSVEVWAGDEVDAEMAQARGED